MRRQGQIVCATNKSKQTPGSAPALTISANKTGGTAGHVLAIPEDVQLALPRVRAADDHLLVARLGLGQAVHVSLHHRFPVDLLGHLDKALQQHLAAPPRHGFAVPETSLAEELKKWAAPAR